MANILIFGASIAYGYGDSRGGWAQRLRTQLDSVYFGGEREFIGVYNLGMSGKTTEYVLEIIDYEGKYRQAVLPRKTATIISIGTNDAAIDTERNEFLVPIEKYRENLGKIIEKAKIFSQQLFLVEILPVDESRTIPVWSNTKLLYLNKNIEEYNKVQAEVAASCGVPVIGFEDTFDREPFARDMLRDGLHPNDEGHELIYQVVKKALEEKGII